MKRIVLLLIFLGFLNVCAAQPEQIVVTGKVVGHDGQPMPAAMVALRGMNVQERAFPGEDGAFSFTLDHPGSYYLWIAGPHHKSMLRPLFIDEPRPVALEVRMSTPDYVEEIDSVLVIGAFNDFSTDEGGRPMERLPDGTFAATIDAPADTFAYQLMGVQVDDYMLGGTLADYFVYDQKYPIFSNRAGKFISVVQAGGDSVHITFDLRDLPRSEAAVSFEFQDKTSRTARLTAFYEDLSRRSDRFIKALKAHRDAGDQTAFEYNWSDDQADLKQMIEAEEDPILQQYLLLNYFSRLRPTPEDSLFARRVFEDILPSSLLWSLEWVGPINTFIKTSRIAKQPDVVEAYSRRVIEEHPDSTVIAAFLSYEVGRAFQAMKKEKYAMASDEVPGVSAAAMDFSIYYDRLMTEFGDTPDARRAKARYAPTRSIQPGNPIPDFAVASLDDSTMTITPETLTGKVYLIEFWAVWCGPCIGEMDYLHAAYDQFKDRGFTILSLSFDNRPEEVAEFRQDRWTMPWLHGFVENGFRSALAEQFEVVGIPKAILVDETGIIVATESELRRDRLAETLARVFGDTE